MSIFFRLVLATSVVMVSHYVAKSNDCVWFAGQDKCDFGPNPPEDVANCPGICISDGQQPVCEQDQNFFDYGATGSHNV